MPFSKAVCFQIIGQNIQLAEIIFSLSVSINSWLNHLQSCSVRRRPWLCFQDRSHHNCWRQRRHLQINQFQTQVRWNCLKVVARIFVFVEVIQFSFFLDVQWQVVALVQKATFSNYFANGSGPLRKVKNARLHFEVAVETLSNGKCTYDAMSTPTHRECDALVCCTFVCNLVDLFATLQETFNGQI